jgi:pimeloyl-ACP methyl ester carboxylesterase
MKRVLLILCGAVSLGAIVIAASFLYLSGSRPYQEVSIPANGYELTAYLSDVDRTGDLWVIFGHGNRKEGVTHPLYTQILNNLPKDVGVLAINFRGFAGSADDRMVENERILDRSEDIQAAVDYLIDRKGITENQIILIGHSFGAAQVANAASQGSYRLVIPIGLGDWQSVTTDPRKMMAYLRKFEENTGVTVSREQFIREGSQFISQAITDPCPTAPIAFVFAGFDDGKEPMRIQYQKTRERCPTLVGWKVVPFANHTYGTEESNLPVFLQRIYSKIVLGYLVWQLNHLISS